MRILVLSQYFWPEGFIINDVVRVLVEQGHEVVVATGKPNYPDGKIYDGYRARGTQTENYEGKVTVVRVPLWPRGRGGAVNLILNYLSFVVAGLALFPWLLRGQKFDSILVFAPSPIIQAIPAIALKWLKNARLALWVQDLWPESLSATGFVRNQHVLRAVGWVVKAIYKACDTVLVQSRAFVEPVARYTEQRKIHYYPNSIDARSVTPDCVLDENLLACLDDHFCVVFAGNLGTAQALDTLVAAAVLLRDDADIRLVLVGSGSRLEWLRSQQKALNLSNLILPGRFPASAMKPIFQRSSALLVSLNDDAAFARTVPSKVQAYLAAGRPIIASLNGEGGRVVLESGAGVVSPAEAAQPLVDNIREIKSMDDNERALMGAAGRQYFEANFEMVSQVSNLVELLKR